MIRKFVSAHPVLLRLAKRLLATETLRKSSLYRAAHRARMRREMRRLAVFPRQLNIELTNACNAKCIMCPRESMTRRVGIMDEALFQRLIDQVAGRGLEAVVINGYGESLLDKRLLDRVCYAKKKGVENLVLYTNGSILPEEVAAGLMDAGLDRLSVSLDGFSPATFERVRAGLKFDQVVGNLDRLLAMRKARSSKTPRVVVTMVQIGENAAEAQDFVSHYGRLADEVYVQSAKNWGGAYEKTGSDGFHEAAREADRMPCRHLWHSMTVLWTGQVSLCCIDFDGKVRLADARQSTLAEIWQSEPFRKVREHHLSGRFQEVGPCASCDYRSVWW